MKTLFLSHASKDSKVANEICALLEGQGLSCWIAPRNVQAGQDFGEQIIRAIEGTTATVLLLSKNANASTFVKKEIERAVSKSKPVFTVRWEDVEPSPGLELFVSSAHWLDLWKAPLDVGVSELANAARPLIGQPVKSVPTSKQPRQLTANIGWIAVMLVLALCAAVYYIASLTNSNDVPRVEVKNPSIVPLPVEKSLPQETAPSTPTQIPSAPAHKNVESRALNAAKTSTTLRPGTKQASEPVLPAVCTTLLEKASSGGTLTPSEQSELVSICK